MNKEDQPGDGVPLLPTIDEFLSAQRTDRFCCQPAETIGTPGSAYDVDRNGFLVRRSTVDDALQKLFPEILRPCMLSLCHDSVTAGYPGSHRMYDTMRQDLYWPHIANDVYDFVRQCSSCVRNGGTQYTVQAPEAP